MLGDKIGTFQGHVTSRRVLPSNGGLPTVETTAEFEGPLLGVPSTNIVTYVSEVRPDGSLFGDGNGVSMSAQGDMASWGGQGGGQVYRTGRRQLPGLHLLRDGLGQLGTA